MKVNSETQKKIYINVKYRISIEIFIKSKFKITLSKKEVNSMGFFTLTTCGIKQITLQL